MQRDLKAIANEEFDFVVVGGGIYGSFMALEAAARGFSVALVEKADFGCATSSNSLKIIHGGLRYLQHADIRRMRESIRERRILSSIAPHLVHPLKCVMPTYGHGLRGKEAMSIALFLNDVISFDRNRVRDVQKRLPPGKVISRKELMEMIPDLTDTSVTGGAVWYDCQAHSPERLLIAVLHSAVNYGARIANYLAMETVLVKNDRVVGVRVRDSFSGEHFDVRGKMVINCTGPWTNHIIEKICGRPKISGIEWSAAMNLVLRRKLFPDYAVGLWANAEYDDKDAIFHKQGRMYLFSPWRDRSLAGTAHYPFDGHPEEFRVTLQTIESFLSEVSSAYPAAKLTLEDVEYYYAGLLPAANGSANDHNGVRLLKHYRIIDHGSDALEGLISVIGVKLTTARDVAEKTVNYVMRKWNKEPAGPSPTRSTPLWGGDIDNFKEFYERETNQAQPGWDTEALKRLVVNYGREYKQILQIGNENPNRRRCLGKTNVTEAEVVFAVREEMAMTLEDIVRRRTDLGTAGKPDDDALLDCARVAADELGWDSKRTQTEIDNVRKRYQLPTN